MKYHAPDTWHDTTPRHIILTLGRPVLALPCKSECQARSSQYCFLTTLVCHGPGSKPWPPALEQTLYQATGTGGLKFNTVTSRGLVLYNKPSTSYLTDRSLIIICYQMYCNDPKVHPDQTTPPSTLFPFHLQLLNAMLCGKTTSLTFDGYYTIFWGVWFFCLNLGKKEMKWYEQIYFSITTDHIFISQQITYLHFLNKPLWTILYVHRFLPLFKNKQEISFKGLFDRFNSNIYDSNQFFQIFQFTFLLFLLKTGTRFKSNFLLKLSSTIPKSSNLNELSNYEFIGNHFILSFINKVHIFVFLFLKKKKKKKKSIFYNFLKRSYISSKHFPPKMSAIYTW